MEGYKWIRWRAIARETIRSIGGGAKNDHSWIDVSRNSVIVISRYEFCYVCREENEIKLTWFIINIKFINLEIRLIMRYQVLSVILKICTLLRFGIF